jgi:adenylate cyclase
VLEGSIQKYQNTLRISANLINCADGSTIWGEKYDKEYKDIFDIQDEVSHKIVENLITNLTSSENVEIRTERPTNMEAWEYYAKGKHIYGLYFDKYDTIYLANSIEQFKKAIEYDPKFVPPYAYIAEVYDTYHNFVAEKEEDQNRYRDLMEKYVNAGFEIDKNSAHLYWGKGSLLINKGKLQEGIDSYVKALELYPNHKMTLDVLGFHLGMFGLSQKAIKFYNKIISLEPTDDAYRYRAYWYYSLGDLEKAESDILKALEITPNSFNNLTWYAEYLLLLGRRSQAKDIYVKASKLNITNQNLENRIKATIYAFDGEKEEALRIYPEGTDVIFYLLDMHDEAIDNLRDRLSDWDNIYLQIKNSPLYDPLRFDPRFQKLLSEVKVEYEENLEKFGDIDI